MSLLQCSHCGKDISATHKACPHCGEKVSFWGEAKKTIEQSRLRQAGLAVLVMFLLGTSWYIRMSTGLRWPLYGAVIVSAPIFLWLLQLAYKHAAPVETEEAKAREMSAQQKNDAETADDQKIWRG